MKKATYLHEVTSSSLIIAFSSAIILKNVSYNLSALSFVLFVFAMGGALITFNNLIFPHIMNANVKYFTAVIFLKNIIMSIALSIAITIYSLIVTKYVSHDISFTRHIITLIISVIIPLSFLATYAEYQNSKNMF